MKRSQFMGAVGRAAFGLGASAQLSGLRSEGAVAATEKIKIGQIGAAHAHASGKIATIRVALIEVQGERRRQFVVCGDQGAIDIRPLEPPKILLALSRPRGGFKSGYQEVNLPPLAGRYDGDCLDLARIIRGEKAPSFGPAHDLGVHEAVLRASGLPPRAGE
ncbi:hypothetical protein FJY63_02650 [Candidatus Sumerlaeota bacterium]|nr:hypothetical protein [Candidatus Sumerlaeota bacterium]